MSQLDKIKITLDGIGQLLKVNKLEVPKYQRYYAWEEKHVTDLLDDISSAMRNDESEYFIGSIVVKKNIDNRAEVVDGQQRLATITILINAIKEQFEKASDQKRAFKISNDYIVSHDLRTEEEVPHLILNQTDHQFFVESVIGNNDVSNKAKLRSSHARLLNAKDLTNKKIYDVLQATNNDLDTLIDWIEYISNNVRVIWVEVPDYSNAFTIFETLNDRGLDLAISDLLKNYLFHKSGNSIDKTQTNWITMTGILEAAEGDSIIVPYIKYLWSSFYGNVREKELYNQIKNTIKSKTSALEFSSNLSKNASLYVAILYSDHSFWADYSTSTRNYIRIINVLGMVQVRSLLMSILTAFNKKETEKSIKSIVSIIVRLLVSGTLSSGVFERQFSNSAMKVRKGEITNLEELLSSLKGILPSDTKFKEEFKKFNVSKSSLAKYLLSTIENYLRDKTGSELIPNNDDAIVNLEHILPKTLSDNWTSFNEDEHKMYFKRLGNQTLLDSKKNSRLGNIDYMEKKKVYTESDFIITNTIEKEFSIWNPESINKRQEDFAEYALKCWRL